MGERIQETYRTREEDDAPQAEETERNLGRQAAEATQAEVKETVTKGADETVSDIDDVLGELIDMSDAEAAEKYREYVQPNGQ